MEPKFKIGELVVRQAPDGNYPEHNGEYVILGIITAEQYKKLHPRTSFKPLASNFHYELSGLRIRLPTSGEISRHSAEAFLKKKHLPSSESFDKLMSSLKTTTEGLICL